MATSEIPTAAAKSSGMSEAWTAGRVGIGKPLGRTPITETPRAARSRTIESPIATTTATRMPGVRGDSRLRPRIRIRLRRPIPSAAGVRLVGTLETNATASLTRPLASVENPNSLGSCPMKMTTLW